MAMKQQMEYKAYKFSVDTANDEAGVFGGHAAIFDEIDTYGDSIMVGAFKKTLKEHKFWPLTWTHDQMQPLGIAFAEEDDKGLRVTKGDLNQDVQRAREIRSLAKQGAVTGMSIGFRSVREEIDKDTGIRKLKEIKLYEIALCMFPSNDSARVTEVKAAGFKSAQDFYGSTELWVEKKPYPNEHSCRLQDPGKFDRFRRGTRESDGKEYSIIFGRVKDSEDWEEQAYRYDKDTWTAAEASAHCKAHKGSFEAAEKCEDCTFTDTEPGRTTPPDVKPQDKDLDKSDPHLRGLIDELRMFVESH